MNTILMRRDATVLSQKDIDDILTFRDVKGGGMNAARKYKIGGARVYKIWRSAEASDAKAADAEPADLINAGGPRVTLV